MKYQKYKIKRLALHLIAFSFVLLMVITAIEFLLLAFDVIPDIFIFLTGLPMLLLMFMLVWIQVYCPLRCPYCQQRIIFTSKECPKCHKQIRNKQIS